MDKARKIEALGYDTLVVPDHLADEILRNPFVLIGTVDQLTEDLIANRERWDISSYAIVESSIDDFAPVVARLAGK
jgi:hypothetical protein